MRQEESTDYSQPRCQGLRIEQWPHVCHRDRSTSPRPSSVSHLPSASHCSDHKSQNHLRICAFAQHQQLPPLRPLKPSSHLHPKPAVLSSSVSPTAPSQTLANPASAGRAHFPSSSSYAPFRPSQSSTTKSPPHQPSPLSSTPFAPTQPYGRYSATKSILLLRCLGYQEN